MMRSKGRVRTGILQHSPINVGTLVDVEHMEESVVMITGKRFSE